MSDSGVDPDENPKKRCVYCGLDKAESEFSDEHIWPEALGGDYLDSTWRTSEVCERCNGLSGVFVDGAFIKGWMGSAERATGAREYLSVSRPGQGALPLHYMGRLPDAKLPAGEMVEFWIGPCGEHILHVRPEDKEELWSSYAGGDPRRGSRKKHGGRAYLTFTSTEKFWILTTLAGFKKQFLGKRYVVNAELPTEWTSFEKPNESDPSQKADLAIVEEIRATAQRGEDMQTALTIALDADARFLSKLALAIGYKVLGPRFLETPYAATLRRGFREANPEKRRQIQVMGSGYFSEEGLGGAAQLLKWPGAWVLELLVVQGKLTLVVITPAGKAMTVLVSEDPTLIKSLPKKISEGCVWLTIPSLGEAVGPLSFSEYLDHQTNNRKNYRLEAIEAKRVDPSSLPRCRPS